MKRYYLFATIIILFCNSLYSQWAPIGAKWVYDCFPGSPNVNVTLKSVKDTIILGKKCIGLQDCLIANEEDSTGHYYLDTACTSLQYLYYYLYYDSSKVYSYDNTLKVFYMLYNFNAKIGDTITVWNSLSGYPSYLFQYKIDSIGDTIINGINLREQYISPTPNSDWVFYHDLYPYDYKYYPLIERIGSLGYLFGFPIYVIEGGISGLICYHDSTISLGGSNTSPCINPSVNIKETKNLQNNIKVFPNPANDYITFQSSMPFYDNLVNINIYNITGAIVKSLTFSNEKINYRMNTLNLNGFYYYVVYNNGMFLKSGTFIIIH